MPNGRKGAKIAEIETYVQACPDLHRRADGRGLWRLAPRRGPGYSPGDLHGGAVMAVLIPAGRVLPPLSDKLVADLAAGATERLLLVDVERLRVSKSFAKLRKEAPSWSDDDLIERLLHLMAQGPA